MKVQMPGRDRREPVTGNVLYLDWHGGLPRCKHRQKTFIQIHQAVHFTVRVLNFNRK